MRSHEKGKKQSFNDIDCFFFCLSQTYIHLCGFFIFGFVCLICFCQLCFVYQLWFCLLWFIYLISDTLDLRRADNIALFALTYQCRLTVTIGRAEKLQHRFLSHCKMIECFRLQNELYSKKYESLRAPAARLELLFRVFWFMIVLGFIGNLLSNNFFCTVCLSYEYTFLC